MDEIVRLGVAALADAVRDGRVQASVADAAYRARIASHNDRLKAFTALAPAHGGSASGALAGVPLAIKANIDVAGLATTAGLAARREATAASDAPLVAALRAAGAAILGHTNLHEAAIGATTDNPHYGRTENPHAPGHSPGGSSGGSGAAVAAGLCAAAIGSDTMGSIRIPASFCGIYGLKPTHGLVDSAGMVPLCARFDVAGPMARALADIDALMAVLAPSLPPPAPLERVALLRPVDAAPLDRAVADGYRLAASLLEGLGIAVDTHDAPEIDFDLLRRATYGAMVSEGEQRFGALPGLSDEAAGAFQFGIAWRALEGEMSAAVDAAAARLGAVLQVADAILLPTTPMPAPRHGQAGERVADFTLLANISGLPALALPAGWTSDGLPVSVQLMGRRLSEASLIALAQRLDGALRGYAMPRGF